MPEIWITLLGLTAGACTTVSLVPQVIKALRSRRTEDISLLMYVILSAGLFLWLVYGLIRGDLPLILANSLSFTLSLAVLLLKIRHG